MAFAAGNLRIGMVKRSVWQAACRKDGKVDDEGNRNASGSPMPGIKLSLDEVKDCKSRLLKC